MDTYTTKTAAKASEIEDIVALEEIVIPAPRYVEISRINRYAMRSCDVIISTMLIVFVLSWLYPLLALLIKISSKGPVVFVQQRIGFDNKTFFCYKFRSMYVNIDANTQEARENDARITFIGNWLRKLYIDELPQLINVLFGEMSIVGPRPHMLYHHEKFSATIPYYKDRHKVKPGITGLAQIKGYHGSVSEYYQINGRTKLDLFYIRNYSFGLYLKILFATFFIVTHQKKCI